MRLSSASCSLFPLLSRPPGRGPYPSRLFAASSLALRRASARPPVSRLIRCFFLSPPPFPPRPGLLAFSHNAPWPPLLPPAPFRWLACSLPGALLPLPCFALGFVPPLPLASFSLLVARPPLVRRPLAPRPLGLPALPPRLAGVFRPCSWRPPSSGSAPSGCPRAPPPALSCLSSLLRPSRLFSVPVRRPLRPCAPPFLASWRSRPASPFSCLPLPPFASPPLLNPSFPLRFALWPPLPASVSCLFASSPCASPLSCSASLGFPAAAALRLLRPPPASRPFAWLPLPPLLSPSRPTPPRLAWARPRRPAASSLLSLLPSPVPAPFLSPGSSVLPPAALPSFFFASLPRVCLRPPPFAFSPGFLLLPFSRPPSSVVVPACLFPSFRPRFRRRPRPPACALAPSALLRSPSPCAAPLRVLLLSPAAPLPLVVSAGCAPPLSPLPRSFPSCLRPSSAPLSALPVLPPLPLALFLLPRFVVPAPASPSLFFAPPLPLPFWSPFCLGPRGARPSLLPVPGVLPPPPLSALALAVGLCRPPRPPSSPYRRPLLRRGWGPLAPPFLPCWLSAPWPFLGRSPFVSCSAPSLFLAARSLPRLPLSAPRPPVPRLAALAPPCVPLFVVASFARPSLLVSPAPRSAPPLPASGAPPLVLPSFAPPPHTLPPRVAVPPPLPPLCSLALSGPSLSSPARGLPRVALVPSALPAFVALVRLPFPAPLLLGSSLLPSPSGPFMLLPPLVAALPSPPRSLFLLRGCLAPPPPPSAPPAAPFWVACPFPGRARPDTAFLPFSSPRACRFPSVPARSCLRPCLPLRPVPCFALSLFGLGSFRPPPAPASPLLPWSFPALPPSSSSARPRAGFVAPCFLFPLSFPFRLFRARSRSLPLLSFSLASFPLALSGSPALCVSLAPVPGFPPLCPRSLCLCPSLRLFLFCVWPRPSLWPPPLLRPFLCPPSFAPAVFGLPLLPPAWPVLFLVSLLFPSALAASLPLPVLLCLLSRAFLPSCLPSPARGFVSVFCCLFFPACSLLCSAPAFFPCFRLRFTPLFPPRFRSLGSAFAVFSSAVPRRALRVPAVPASVFFFSGLPPPPFFWLFAPLLSGGSRPLCPLSLPAVPPPFLASGFPRLFSVSLPSRLAFCFLPFPCVAVFPPFSCSAWPSCLFPLPPLASLGFRPRVPRRASPPCSLPRPCSAPVAVFRLVCCPGPRPGPPLPCFPSCPLALSSFRLASLSPAALLSPGRLLPSPSAPFVLGFALPFPCFSRFPWPPPLLPVLAPPLPRPRPPLLPLLSSARLSGSSPPVLSPPGSSFPFLLFLRLPPVLVPSGPSPVSPPCFPLPRFLVLWPLSRPAAFGFLGCSWPRCPLRPPSCPSPAPSLRFSPPPAPRSLLSPSLGPFPRSRLSSLLPLRPAASLGPLPSRSPVPLAPFPLFASAPRRRFFFFPPSAAPLPLFSSAPRALSRSLPLPSFFAPPPAPFCVCLCSFGLFLSFLLFFFLSFLCFFLSLFFPSLFFFLPFPPSFRPLGLLLSPLPPFLLARGVRPPSACFFAPPSSVPSSVFSSSSLPSVPRLPPSRPFSSVCLALLPFPFPSALLPRPLPPWLPPCRVGVRFSLRFCPLRLGLPFLPAPGFRALARRPRSFRCPLLCCRALSLCSARLRPARGRPGAGPVSRPARSFLFSSSSFVLPARCVLSSVLPCWPPSSLLSLWPAAPGGLRGPRLVPCAPPGGPLFPLSPWLLALPCRWPLLSLRLPPSFPGGPSLPARPAARPFPLLSRSALSFSSSSLPPCRRSCWGSPSPFCRAASCLCSSAPPPRPLSFFRGLPRAWPPLRPLAWPLPRAVAPVPSALVRSLAPAAGVAPSRLALVLLPLFFSPSRVGFFSSPSRLAPAAPPLLPVPPARFRSGPSSGFSAPLCSGSPPSSLLFPLGAVAPCLPFFPFFSSPSSCAPPSRLRVVPAAWRCVSRPFAFGFVRSLSRWGPGRALPPRSRVPLPWWPSSVRACFSLPPRPVRFFSFALLPRRARLRLAPRLVGLPCAGRAGSLAGRALPAPLPRLAPRLGLPAPSASALSPPRPLGPSCPSASPGAFAPGSGCPLAACLPPARRPGRGVSRGGRVRPASAPALGRGPPPGPGCSSPVGCGAPGGLCPRRGLRLLRSLVRPSLPPALLRRWSARLLRALGLRPGPASSGRPPWGLFRPGRPPAGALPRGGRRPPGRALLFPGAAALPVSAASASAPSVPAAAVRPRLPAFSGLLGRPASVGGFSRPPSPPRAPPWPGGGPSPAGVRSGPRAFPVARCPASRSATPPPGARPLLGRPCPCAPPARGAPGLRSPVVLAVPAGSSALCVSPRAVLSLPRSVSRLGRPFARLPLPGLAGGPPPRWRLWFPSLPRAAPSPGLPCRASSCPRGVPSGPRPPVVPGCRPLVPSGVGFRPAPRAPLVFRLPPCVWPPAPPAGAPPAAGAAAVRPPAPSALGAPRVPLAGPRVALRPGARSLPPPRPPFGLPAAPRLPAAGLARPRRSALRRCLRSRALSPPPVPLWALALPAVVPFPARRGLPPAGLVPGVPSSPGRRPGRCGWLPSFSGRAPAARSVCAPLGAGRLLSFLAGAVRPAPALLLLGRPPLLGSPFFRPPVPPVWRPGGAPGPRGLGFLSLLASRASPWGARPGSSLRGRARPLLLASLCLGCAGSPPPGSFPVLLRACPGAVAPPGPLRLASSSCSPRRLPPPLLLRRLAGALPVRSPVAPPFSSLVGSGRSGGAPPGSSLLAPPTPPFSVSGPLSLAPRFRFGLPGPLAPVPRLFPPPPSALPLFLLGAGGLVPFAPFFFLLFPRRSGARRPPSAFPPPPFPPGRPCPSFSFPPGPGAWLSPSAACLVSLPPFLVFAPLRPSARPPLRALGCVSFSLSLASPWAPVCPRLFACLGLGPAVMYAAPAECSPIPIFDQARHLFFLLVATCRALASLSPAGWRAEVFSVRSCGAGANISLALRSWFDILAPV
ncbi:hypothetical protein CKAN_02770500 [Cinnamomum micranthum f. kanehirae]|uniref:Uncharacterized protein ycf68 n=1 Tax=Cinnamomum micranthum f. kanehirae TaxID=337451 RepID=A0A3S4Q306_9MAGN|nr:hypothetical protein CKAN_02770500 [Cinnamomum micranthum f. kanehirae]